MKKLLVRFTVFNSIAGTGYEEMWVEQDRPIGEWGILAADCYAVNNNVHLILRDRWDCEMTAEERGKYKNFSSFMSAEAGIGWREYEIIDIERGEFTETFNEIVSVDGVLFRPKEPIQLKCHEKTMVACERDDLDIYILADSTADMMWEFRLEMISLLRLCTYDERTLKRGFQQIRRKMLNMFERMEESHE